MGDVSHEVQQKVIVACAAYGTSFCVFTAISLAVLCRVNWRPWRLYSYVIMQKWPSCFKDYHLLCTLSGILSCVAWALVLSPVLVLVLWGVRLVLLLEKDTIGLAVIMPGTALLFSVYAIMLWWRTQWQSSRVVAVMLFIAVSLLCGYEIAAVYVTAGRNSSKHYSSSGFFFGVSAIALAINMLFICKMVFDGSGINLDEYVRRSYKYAYADSIEVGPVACLPEPPDLKVPALQKKTRSLHYVISYLGSVMVLTTYSILYGFTAKKAHWLGGVTSVAVIILDANVGACVFGFELLKSRVVALFIVGICRIFLICFGVYYWYLGHCACYVVVASVLLGAVVARHFSASDAATTRKVFLETARVRLRAGFRRKVPGSTSSFSEGHGSSTKCSSSVDPSQIVLWNGVAQGTVAGIDDACEGLNSARSIDSGRGSVTIHTSSRPSTVQESDLGVHAVQGHAEKFWPDTHKASICGPSHVLEVHNIDSSVSNGVSGEPVVFDTNINDHKSGQSVGTRPAEQELSILFQDKGLDPNFAVMFEETGIHPPLMALLQRASLDADRDHRDNTEVIDATGPQVGATHCEIASIPDELQQNHWEVLLHRLLPLFQFITGTPERAWLLFSVIFIAESVLVAVFHPMNVRIINATHQQFIFGFSALLLSPVICSIIAFIYALQAEKMVLNSRSRKFGMIAWLLSTSVGLMLSFLSKSSILLGVSITVPLMSVCLAFLIPIWVSNNYQFYVLPVDDQNSAHASANQQGCLGSKEGSIMTISILLLMGCIFALGAIISLKPLDDLNYPHGWIGDQTSIFSPYTSSIYLGWAVASAFALVISGALPVVSWFATYRFSTSSAVCVGIFIVVLFTFCGGSYVGVVKTRDGQVPIKADLLAALLPLVCIPAIFCLCCGLYKWKDDGWQFSRGVYLFLGTGLSFLFGGVSAVIATIDPWMIGVAVLLFILLLVMTVSAIHYWASHSFYLTRVEMLLVCLAAFVLALAAFLVGLLADEPFVGASVGYFTLLFLLAGRALAVLLSCPVVVYSPRLLPAYVYDAHADCAKNVSGAYLVLYGVALAAAGWGVIASIELYPPFTGAATSSITLVVAFGFAVSRPPRTCKMMESALQFLSKETIVHAIVRAATKTRNALSGTYSAPQRSASSTALLVGDPKMGRDKGGNYVLPREDVLKLRERLHDQETFAKSWFCKPRGRMIYHHLESCSEAQAHAKIFLLEEALDTEWVYMWDKFGGYLLLLLGLAAKAEKVQDELRLQLFLDNKGFSDLNERKMKEWQSEDYREFEVMQESFIREKEMEDELMLQRREEDDRGKERRKLLLEKEERRRRELEAAALSSVPNTGNKEVAAVAAAARAVSGDALYDEVRAVQQVSYIVQRVLSRQKAERAYHIGVEGAVCVVDSEPVSDGRLCGIVDPTLCSSSKVTFSATVLVEVGSGPVCLLGIEARNRYCLEILVSGADLLAFEGGQVGLRLVTKGDHQTMMTRDWTIGSQNLADGRWHTVSVTIDADAGEAATYVDGKFDDSQSGISIHAGVAWIEGAEMWVGVKPPLDLDAFGRSDSEGVEPRMQIMDIFVWSRCLSMEELEAVHNKICVDENRAKELWEDEWQSDTSSCRGEESASDPADIDLYVREELLSQEQLQSGRKRKAERELAIEMDNISRKLRRPKMETEEEVNQRMRAVELAVKEALAVRGERQFTDQEFPPSNQSLFVDPEKPSIKLQVVNEWMRPLELLRERGRSCEPCLFAGPADASDVCQGRLGDCWFLSAVAVLTEASRISQIIVTPAYNEYGIYIVRFCIQGEWVPVVVDDWIPCESRGKPAFATSRKDNELWVTLLEKAYAKLHGSYEALEGGLVQDALVDLTGGAGEEIDLKSAQAHIDLASGRLWSQLLRFKQEGFLLGAGSPSGSDVDVSSTGIVQGHAYSVLQVKEVDGHKLLQIHNPWANGVEWNGPWSDLSSEWTDRMKHKLKYSPQAQDGVFWMSWEDFQLHFCSIYVCRIYPPEMRYSIRGQWRGATAGGCQDYLSWPSNPQFHLKAIGADARYPIHVFLTLTQGVHFSSKKRSGFANYQSSGDPSNYYIGMRILQTGGHRARHNIFMHESIGGTDYVNSREIAFEMVLDPAPNGYTIVPSTLNPLEEAPFVLSVFTKASIKLEPL